MNVWHLTAALWAANTLLVLAMPTVDVLRVLASIGALFASLAAAGKQPKRAMG